MNARVLAVAALLLVISSLAAGCTAPEPQQSWNLTVAEVVNGTEISSLVLTLDDVYAMPSYSGYGYAVSTVGIKYGPYRCRGVRLSDIAALAGEVLPRDRVWVSAPDGYLWVFDEEQIRGEAFITFDEDLHEVTSPPLTVLLMYEQDGRLLQYDDGGPLRIAIVSNEPGIITEGSSWVKWVDRIELRRG
jgi:DMSO/TMAO reductase YedYZ molybdopterin-dependent catalytic subunit